jgi:vacuolar-type H+-ATPase subunit I/STV1
MEQVEVRKKELFNEKNVNSKWDGKKWENEKEHFDLIEEISAKTVKDLTKPMLKEFLIKLKSQLVQVKDDLQRVSGNLNSEEFIRHEKVKVDEIKTSEDSIRKTLKSKYHDFHFKLKNF